MTEAKLHFIGTPLGNRLDITLRALEVLKSLSVFFAEDSREFFKLLDLYEIPHANKKVHSYGNHNLKEATQKALNLLSEGHQIGFLSDRGMPGISDPGAVLAERAQAAGYEVIPVPGPSAVTTALSVSGKPANRFFFVGFLPPTQKEKAALFSQVRQLGITTCFYESPKRIQDLLSELAREFPTGEVFLAREMTKAFETYTFFALSNLSNEEISEKGEYVVVLTPGASENLPEAWMEDVRLRLAPDKEWAKSVAARYDLAASDVYNALQREKKLKNS